jgi:hypothetical protein
MAATAVPNLLATQIRIVVATSRSCEFVLTIARVQNADSTGLSQNCEHTVDC